MPPLQQTEKLHEVCLEHARSGHKQPVWRVDQFEILLSIEVPHLGHERLLGVDKSADLLLEGANDHGVGHAKTKRMVKLHLFVYFLKILVFEQIAPSWVMALEG